MTVHTSQAEQQQNIVFVGFRPCVRVCECLYNYWKTQILLWFWRHISHILTYLLRNWAEQYGISGAMITHRTLKKSLSRCKRQTHNDRDTTRVMHRLEKLWRAPTREFVRKRTFTWADQKDLASEIKRSRDKGEWCRQLMTSQSLGHRETRRSKELKSTDNGPTKDQWLRVGHCSLKYNV